MRSILLGAAAIVVSGCCAAFAQAPCDQLCVLMKRAVAERASDFAKLQSEKVGELLPSSVSPPGMGCGVEKYQGVSVSHPRGEPYVQFSCSTLKGADKESKNQLKRVVAELRRSEPKWKWFKGEGGFGNTSVTSYYGGPTRNELYAEVAFSNTAAEPGLYAASSGTIVHLDTTPINVRDDLKPYTP